MPTAAASFEIDDAKSFEANLAAFIESLVGDARHWLQCSSRNCQNCLEATLTRPPYGMRSTPPPQGARHHERVAVAVNRDRGPSRH
jgi:hypothetical protein